MDRVVVGGAVISPERSYLSCYYRRRKTPGERIGEGVTNIKLNIIDKNTENPY
jgi:hypothetical protein